MNVNPRIQAFCCPTCRGFIGEAAPIASVRDALSKPMLIKIFDVLSDRVGKNVRRSFIIDVCYEDDEDGGPEDAEGAFRVNLHNLRKIISRYGWHIECVGGMGRGDFNGGFYRLMPIEAGQ